ncbi:beta-lactamase family protein [Sphingomonas sp. S1-29]|uniref:serine hydrolase domain-containing protein n=1 Tax=Sphingomonas sp. S1-29 TaxID=2991074 RepID=UPI00223F2020|nr:serine hydrolase domain-containing protein [Sphingomonas sp. S1-29]UZK69764.1 beta-lactamase family protein [Sphingomonas sp. S1-29]
MTKAMLAAGGALALAGGVAVLLTGHASPTDAPANPTAPRAVERMMIPLADAQPSIVDYGRLESRIATLMRERDMVGLAIGTVEKGRVRFIKGYGETLASSGAAVTPDTVFRWASVSKGVASALVVGLAEDGKLSLDSSLASMRTTLTLPGDARSVTVADLLSHRLGLVRNAWDDRLEAGQDPKLLRASLGTLAQYCPPATCYGYQNIAFDAASELVEQATGQAYASVAQERLFAPLGMTTASVGRAGLQGAESWAQPHRWNRTPTTVNDNYYRVPAAGGVNSSILDLTRWMQAQMGDAPAILSPAALEAMHRPRVSTPPKGRRGAMDRALTNAAYGLGWRSYTYAGHALVGHRGSVDGYGSLVLFDPAEKSGIVMLWNSNTSKPARLQLEFFDMLYRLPPTDWLDLPVQPNAATAVTAVAASPGKAAR